MMKKNLFNIFFIFLIIGTLFVSPVFANESNDFIESASMQIFAVTASKVAMTATLNIEIQEGSGKIYSSINSAVGTTTQESERHAVKSANAVIDDTENKYNYFFDIESSASSVDGPSAGSAMALLLVSMLSNKDLSGQVSITGTISENGLVGDVGGIYEKSKKAGEVGIKLFMIPKGNRSQMISNDDGSVELVDLVDYAYTNWGLKIVEVEDIEDILHYASMNIEDIDINAEVVGEKYEAYDPDNLEFSKTLEPMRKIVDQYVEDSNTTLTNAEKSVTESIIKDSTVVQGLLSLLSYAKTAVEDAHMYSSKNYLYTAANNAFLAKVYAITVDEVVNNPSILTRDSTLFDIKLEELKKKLALVENRSKLCTLDNLEWCVGAKQRITWAQNKITDIEENTSNTTQTVGLLDRVTNYSYAVGWIEIANDFLDIGIRGSDVKFVETNQFKEKVEENIIDIENKLIIVDTSIASDEDLSRRIESAKTNAQKGWYVTAYYDIMSAKAVLESRQESKSEFFDTDMVETKYSELANILRTSKALKSTENVWSKLYLDHAIYYYDSYKFNTEEGNNVRADSDVKIANSIFNLAAYLYDTEYDVLSYYNNADIGNIIAEVIDNENNTDVDNDVTDNTKPEVVHIYAKEKGTSFKDVVLYIVIAGLFAMVIAIVFTIEKSSNAKIRIQKRIADLDEQLMDGQISAFTYKEMRNKYILELKKLKHTRVNKNQQLLAKKMTNVHPALSKTKKAKTTTKSKKK